MSKWSGQALIFTVELITVTLERNVILAGEEPSLVDSVTALEAALAVLGEASTIVDSIAPLPCGTSLDRTSRVWCLMGTFPDNTALTEDTGAFLVSAIASGIPVYVEGGDIWGFDAPTAFATIDGVEDGTAEDGDDTFTDMVGFDFGAALLAGMDASYTQDQARNDFTDRLFPATDDGLGPEAGHLLR